MPDFVPPPAVTVVVTTAPPRYQIHHYPATLIDSRRGRDGAALTLRPVLPQDDLLLAELVNGLSPAARRNRFHGAVRLSRAHLQAMSQIDYAQQLGLVVSTQAAGAERVIADARYCVHADQTSAEFALMVDEHWQRHGVGRWALLALVGAAQQAGLQWLQGEVLIDNAPMLALVQACGFALCPHPADERLVLAQRRLGQATQAVPARSPVPLRWLRWLRWSQPSPTGRRPVAYLV